MEKAAVAGPDRKLWEIQEKPSGGANCTCCSAAAKIEKRETGNEERIYANNSHR